MKTPTPAKLLSLLLATSLIAGCKPKVEQTDPDVRQVRLMQLKAVNSIESNTYSGELRAEHETRLAFRVAGKVVQKMVRVGDTVKAGQVLARLDASDYQLAAVAATAQQTAANVDVEQNRKEIKRFEALRDQGFISATEFERRTAQLSGASAKADAARAQAHANRNQASYSVLLAEHAGVVVSLDIEPGQVIGAGQIIGKLSSPGNLEVVIAVPESDLAALKTASQHLVRFPALAATPVDATLRELSPEADPLTRTFSAKFSLASMPEGVRPGMTAQLTLAQAATPTLRAPLTALFEHKGQPAVWVWHPKTQQVHAQVVTLGAYHGSEVEIQRGVSAGMEIVTAGAHLLHEGQLAQRAEEL